MNIFRALLNKWAKFAISQRNVKDNNPPHFSRLIRSSRQLFGICLLPFHSWTSSSARYWNLRKSREGRAAKSIISRRLRSSELGWFFFPFFFPNGPPDRWPPSTRCLGRRRRDGGGGRRNCEAYGILLTPHLLESRVAISFSRSEFFSIPLYNATKESAQFAKKENETAATNRSSVSADRTKEYGQVIMVRLGFGRTVVRDE